MQGRLVLANPALVAMLGYEAQPRQMIGQQYSSFIHPAELEQEAAGFARLRAGEVASYRLETRLVRRDGHVVRADLIVSAIRDAVGRNDCPARYYQRYQLFKPRAREPAGGPGAHPSGDLGVRSTHGEAHLVR